MGAPKKPRRSVKGSSASVSGTEIKRKLISALRLFWFYHSPERKIAMTLSRVETPRFKLDGTPAKVADVSNRCVRCQQLFKEKDLAVDHIEPVGKEPDWPMTGDGRWERWFMRLWSPHTNYQVLCRPCHVRKTAEDNNAIARDISKV